MADGDPISNWGAPMVQSVMSLLRPNEGRRQKASFAGLSSVLTSSATPRQRAEPIGSGLRDMTATLAEAARDLASVAEDRLAAHIHDVIEGMSALSCRVAVVGQVKAGKSSFINALAERGELLPTHVNPWTAVATRLHFGMPGKPVTGSDFTFFTAGEWEALGRRQAGEGEMEDGFAEMKQRAEARLGDQFHHLLGKAHFYQSVQPGILQNYLCAGPPVDEVSREIKPGRYADITKTANVYFPLPPLAVPAILIDTPGTNDSTHLRHRITREIIEGADIYIVVLTARQALAGSDIGMLKLLRGLEKKRIIVFINRIDELNGRAADVDIVIARVREELGKVFDSLSIPVVAGSAKWAGLAIEDDAPRLRAETASPAFQALAEEKPIAIPAPQPEDGDLADLQLAFRQASGLEAVSRLLSLFMLSGFVSNHAGGVADVLLSAAEISATNARRELTAIIGHLNDLQATHAPNRNGPGLTLSLAEMTALLKAVGNIVQSLKEEHGSFARQGIARLERSLEAKIRSGGEADGSSPATSAAAAPNSALTLDMPAVRPVEEEDFETEGGERSSWLSSVKEATFGLLRKALAEPAPPQETEKKPSASRGTSLTVPVTSPSRDVSMDSGSSWWSEWMSDRQGSGASVGGQSFGDGRSLDDLSKDGAGLATLKPLAQLTARFNALQSAGGEVGRFALSYEKAVSEACLTIAVCERVTRQVSAIFAPETAG